MKFLVVSFNLHSYNALSVHGKRLVLILAVRNAHHKAVKIEYAKQSCSAAFGVEVSHFLLLSNSVAGHSCRINQFNPVPLLFWFLSCTCLFGKAQNSAISSISHPLHQPTMDAIVRNIRPCSSHGITLCMFYKLSSNISW